MLVTTLQMMKIAMAFCNKSTFFFSDKGSERVTYHVIITGNTRKGTLLHLKTKIQS